MLGSFIGSVRERMERFGASLADSGTASSLEVDEDGGLKITIYRDSDQQAASVEMTGTTEVYFLSLAGGYEIHDIAHDAEGKWAILENFLESARAFAEGKYHEEIYERNGKTLLRTIHLRAEDGPRVISTSGGWLAGLNRLLGYKKSVVYPPSR